MTEHELYQLVCDYDPNDWDEQHNYFDFRVKTYEPSFLVKIGLYSNINELRKDMEDNFPDGGEWFVVLRLFNDGVAECDVWPHDDYIGVKEEMRIRLDGTCTNAIKYFIKEIKEGRGAK